MHYLSAMISELSYLRQANCGGDFLVRLKSARFYAFFVKTHITRVCCVILRRAEFLICVKQTADSAFLYALHPSRSLHFFKNIYKRRLWRCTAKATSSHRFTMLRCRFFVRLKYARLYVFFVYRRPSISPICVNFPNMVLRSGASSGR